ADRPALAFTAPAALQRLRVELGCLAGRDVARGTPGAGTSTAAPPTAAPAPPARGRRSRRAGVSGITGVVRLRAVLSGGGPGVADLGLGGRLRRGRRFGRGRLGGRAVLRAATGTGA